METDLYAGISLNASVSESQVSWDAAKHVMALNLIIARRHPKLATTHVCKSHGECATTNLNVRRLWRRLVSRPSMNVSHHD